jgi:hypothetical protein
MKDQRGIHTSRTEEKTQLNTIVYCAFKEALKDALNQGISKDLPIYEFLEKADLRPDRGIDPLMRQAFKDVVLSQK